MRITLTLMRPTRIAWLKILPVCIGAQIAVAHSPSEGRRFFTFNPLVRRNTLPVEVAAARETKMPGDRSPGIMIA